MSFPMQNVVRHHRIADKKILIALYASRRVESFTNATSGDLKLRLVLTLVGREGKLRGALILLCESDD
jgi:hypothetical protein